MGILFMLPLFCTGRPETVVEEALTGGVVSKRREGVGKFKFLLPKLLLGFDANNFVFAAENHTGLGSLLLCAGVVGKISGGALGISVTGTEFGSSFLSPLMVFFRKVGLSCSSFFPFFLFLAAIFFL